MWSESTDITAITTMHSLSRAGMEALLLHLTTLQSHSRSLTTRPSRNLTIMAIPSMETISRGITTTATTHSQEENNLLLYPTKKEVNRPLFCLLFTSHLLISSSSCLLVIITSTTILTGIHMSNSVLIPLC